MKILSASLIREADAHTIANEPVTSVDLMERAGLACFNKIKKLLSLQTSVIVMAGTGNNGGDGLVIARHFHNNGYNVITYVCGFPEGGSADFKINLKRCREFNVKVSVVSEEGHIPNVPAGSVVIDALFGSGLSRPVVGLVAELIFAINRSGAMVVSIDIPSGLHSDKYTDLYIGAVIRASITFTLQMPKLAMLMAENFKFTGEVEIIPIGLDIGFIEQLDTPYEVFTFSDGKQLFKPRVRVSHKGDYGHGLLIAGSHERGGAAIMASSAALRSGAGLLTVHIPSTLACALNCAMPEAMLSVDENKHYVTTPPPLNPYSVVAAGPGLGQNPETASALKWVLDNWRKTLLFDADALNILAANRDWLNNLPSETILTPHPKEFERLAGKSANDFERLKKAITFASKYNCIIVLKSAFTVVVAPNGKCSFNITGNAGLAKGGSGDTLTGIILGLLCRGYTPWDASRLGVFLHARCAELAAMAVGLDAIIASDVAGFLGYAFKEMETNT